MSVLDQALERFQLAVDAETEQRKRELENLKFQVPELQWPDEAREQRQGGMAGGVPLAPRPMLSIPKLDHPIQLVLNQEKAAHLGVNIHPLSEDADDDTAEMLQALYRRIEVDSKAGLARSWAFERAVKAGRGFYRILTEYDPAAPKGSKDQRIRIKRLLHQEAAYLDPFAEEPDWSDAEWGFVTQWLPWDRYQRQFKQKAKTSDADVSLSEYSDTMLDVLALDYPEWCKGSGESRMVLIAEYFTVAVDDDGNRSVAWRKINGVEVLDEQPWPGRYIPIIPVIGRELIPFDTERRFEGIIGPNKDAQRFFNYAASGVAETMGSEPKNTWVIAEGQEEGHENEFLLANVRNFPYIRYKPTTIAGTPVAPPRREQADTSKLTLGLQALGMAGDFIHAGTGAYEPSLGQESTRAKSGRAIMSLQQQHEQGNSNWIDNLAEISLTHEACVVLDLIPHIYDRPGRIARTLDPEDNHDRVMLNRPFVRQQGKIQPVDPRQPLPQGVNPDDVEHYNLVGGAQYAVTVSVGKAFKSRLEEGNEGLGQLFQAEPELFKILGDLWLGMQTWPGHKAAADRMKKLLPPPLQDQNGQGDPKIELQQAKAQLQQMQQQMQEMSKALETDKVKVDGQIQIAHLKQQADVEMARMTNATKILVARITAAKEAANAAKEDDEEALALMQQQAHEALQNEQDRLHEAAMAQMGHEQSLEQGQVGASQDAALADQSHGHALEQGDQSAQAALAQQAQQAALQPPPTEGAGA